MAIGCSVTTASRKMMVRPASKMLSAISLGAFWRSAPSTSLIMRSRKVSPGLDVIMTMISSESTRVPPVTAERSPPDSRMTGADSPVMADSSTEATPSTTSPSPGTNSPATTFTRSPARSFEPEISSTEPSVFKRLATVSERALRRVSACALPRPSAMASAKFAKSTVNHSQSVICSSNPKPGRCRRWSRIRSKVVTTEPISTTNITGFFISVRGFSLMHESRSAPATMPPVQSDFLVSRVLMMASENPSGMHQQVLEDRPQAERREKCKRADDQNHGDQQEREQRRGNREGAHRFRHDFLARQISGDCQHRNHHEEAAEKHVERAADVVPGRVPVQPGEGRAVIAGHRGVGVQNLRQAVRTGIGNGRSAEGRDDGDAGKHEYDHAKDQHRQHGHLHVVGFDFLAEILRRAANHQARDENGDDDEDDNSVHTRADSAEDHFTDHDVDQRDHAAERRKRVVHAVDRATARVRGDGGK